MDECKPLAAAEAAELTEAAAAVAAVAAADTDVGRALHVYVTQLMNWDNSSVFYRDERLLNSVSGPASKIWYRIPFNESELSISEIPPTVSPTVRPVAILE